MNIEVEIKRVGLELLHILLPGKGNSSCALRASRKSRLQELLPAEKQERSHYFLWAILAYALLAPLLFMQGVMLTRL